MTIFYQMLARMCWNRKSHTASGHINDYSLFREQHSSYTVCNGFQTMAVILHFSYFYTLCKMILYILLSRGGVHFLFSLPRLTFHFIAFNNRIQQKSVSQEYLHSFTCSLDFCDCFENSSVNQRDHKEQRQAC
jgi:hypothetical protein